MVLFLYTSWSLHRSHGTGRMRAFGSQGHAPSALSPCLSALHSETQKSSWAPVQTNSAAAEGRGTLGQGSGWPSRRHSVLGVFYFCCGWGGVEFWGLAALSLFLVCFLETILDNLQPSCSVTLIYYIFIQQTHYEKDTHMLGVTT